MPKVPYTKPPLTYKEQITQLKERGLQVEDEDKALHILENISYYRLSAYWYPMLKSPKESHLFKVEASFDKAFRLYCFDKELRQLVARELEKIEVSVRGKMIYILAQKYGAFWFEDSSIFKDKKRLEFSLKKLKEETKRSDEEFIKSFKKKYSNPFPPSWMVLEISSFGNLSSLYSNLRPIRSKREIANYFKLDDGTFESWLHSFTYVRNLCAHHARFWNKRMGIQPKIPQTPGQQFLNTKFLPNPNSEKSHWRINDRAFFILSMIVYLLNTINPTHSFRSRIKDLFQKYQLIDERALGFPEAWSEEPLWNTDFS